MTPLVALHIVLSLFNVAFWVVLGKWGVIEWMQFRCPEWLWPTKCQFCFFYRLAMLEVLAVQFIAGVRPESLVIVILYPAAMAIISLKFLPSA